MTFQRAAAVLDAVFDRPMPVRSIERIDGDRGVFSEVERVEIDSELGSVVIKHALAGANGKAAAASGAYRREALAYEQILPVTPLVRRPAYFGSLATDDNMVSLVLEDLSNLRAVDQLDGLSHADVVAVAAELGALHERWSGEHALADLEVRRATPSLLSLAGIATGLEVLEQRWRSQIGAENCDTLHALAAVREPLVAAFVDEEGATLCHGDPRADNVVFETTGRAVLFDWQQMAVQFGEADLAWLLATSVTPEVRRTIEADIVAGYALLRRQDAATTWHRYRLGMVLPGLAVLFLAQREITSAATTNLVATSLERIAAAVIDLEVAQLA